MRSGLLTAIYRKSLRITRAARQTATTGETVNLMSNDCQRIAEASLFVNFLWLSPTMMIVALILMWNEVGPSARELLAVLFLSCL